MYALQYVREWSKRLLVQLNEIHSFEGVFIFSQNAYGSKGKKTVVAFIRAQTADTNDNLFAWSNVNAGPSAAFRGIMVESKHLNWAITINFCYSDTSTNIVIDIKGY